MIYNTSEKPKLGGAQEKCKGVLKISYSANNYDHTHYSHVQNMENKCNKAHTSHKNPDHMYFILLRKKSPAYPTKGAGLCTDVITVSGPRLD